MMSDTDLTHVDDEGRARMVDVSGKQETRRLAIAECQVLLSEGILARLLACDLPKGPVIETARIAGIMAAKRTAELIPLCHPIRISEIQVELTPFGTAALRVEATVVATDRTGVEMEAMVAASTAALTVYDMVKAVDRRASISGLRLVRKEGGKSGTFIADSGHP